MNEAESPIRKEAHLSGPGLIWWSVSFPFRDPQFISTFGWGVVLLWLPFFREAFLLRTLRGALRGERHPLASWDVSRRMFGDGFLTFVALFGLQLLVSFLAGTVVFAVLVAGASGGGVDWARLGELSILAVNLVSWWLPLPGGDVSQDPLGPLVIGLSVLLYLGLGPFVLLGLASRRRLADAFAFRGHRSRIAGHGRTVVSVMMGLFLASLVDRGLNGIFTFDSLPSVIFNSVGTLWWTAAAAGLIGRAGRAMGFPPPEASPTGLTILGLRESPSSTGSTNPRE